MKNITLAAFAAAAAFQCFAGVPLDTSADRVKIDTGISYARIGTLVNKDVSQTKNTITIGGETLDRDYANYDEYKEYLKPLGIKRIRLQGGWAKTEKVKGVYDFAWLDHIIDDCIARGIIPWLQTSYGNTIYAGGGTPFLKGGMPSSAEGKEAWNKWVDAMARRYAGKVEWEMWNEPDINKATPLAEIIDINIRSTEIIRKHDPKAKVAALSLASTRPEKFEEYVKAFHELGKLDMFDWISYHGYEYRPEDSYVNVDEMHNILVKYSKKVILRQGENGAPSKGYLGGALAKYGWTETSQAKWALRRMLSDHGRGIWTSYFSISDMHYAPTDSIKVVNVKGLLETNEKHEVVKIKPAFYAVQNLVSVFDMLENKMPAKDLYVKTQASHTIFGYSDAKTGLQSFVVWYDEAPPVSFKCINPTDITVNKANFKDPVLVDLLTGSVYEIPAASIEKNGDDAIFKNLPVYDSPILVTDKSLITFKTLK